MDSPAGDPGDATSGSDPAVARNAAARPPVSHELTLDDDAVLP